MRSTRGKQLLVMLIKNFTLQKRNWRSTFVQCVGAPVVFLTVLFLLQQSDYSLQREENFEPKSESMQGVYRCRGPSPCINVLYYPNTPKVRSYLNLFSENNAKRTGEAVMKLDAPIVNTKFRPTSEIDFAAVESEDFIYEYLIENPNVTNWAIVFHEEKDPNPNIQYQIWFNSTSTADGVDIFGTQLLSFMRGVDEAILSILNDPTAKIIAKLDVNLKEWPKVQPEVLSDAIVQQLGPVFFFCCVMIIFINTISSVLIEKELKLRISMEQMGLKPSIYWVSTILSSTLLVTVGSVTTCASGWLFRFSSFTKTDITFLFTIFLLFGIAMVAFGLFICTFFKRAGSGLFAGIFVFVFGLLFESFVFSTGYIGYIWYKLSTPPIIAKLFCLLPFFNFGMLFLNVSTLTTGKFDLITKTYFPGAGFGWSDALKTIPTDFLPLYGDGTVPDVPPPIVSILWLVLNSVLYFFLTIYLEQVIPDVNGQSKHPLYVFLPSYWGFTSGSADEAAIKWLKELDDRKRTDPRKFHSSVVNEKLEALSLSNIP